MNRTWTMCFAVIAGMLLCSGASLAGNNAGGKARLSWDVFLAVTNLDTLPANPAPLYLLLSGAPDVRALAVDFRWSSNDRFGPGYHVETMPEQTSGCGVTNATNPGGDFDGDTTYTWSIVFPEGYSERSCILYSVGRMSGDTATFCLISVKTKDANGETDELEVLGNATIFGGAASGCPVAVSDVLPHAIVPGRATTLTLRGKNFEPRMEVSLLNEGNRTELGVQVENENTATLTGLLPASAEGPVDVVVSSAAHSDTLRGRLSVPRSRSAYTPRHVVVKFKPGVVRMSEWQSDGSPTDAGLPSRIAELLGLAGVRTMRRLTPSATRENLAGLDTTQLDIYVCELADTNVTSAVQRIVGDRDYVIDAHPSWLRYGMTWPNDARAYQQWWLRNTGQYGGTPGADIHAESAWGRTASIQPVDVVIIDSGVDATHPDLAGRILAGYNYVDPGAPPDDDTYSHGTAIAGIIAAAGNGGGEVAGLAWNARIVPIKVLDENNVVAYPEVLAEALDDMRVAGYKLVNISIAGPGYDPSEATVFRNAWRAGMTILAASGNDNVDEPYYPAAYSGSVIAVGATDDMDRHWDDHNLWPSRIPGEPAGGEWLGSNYGPHLDLVAPAALAIQTTKRVALGSYWDIHVPLQTGYLNFGLTSAAAPMATGVAALVQGLAPTWNQPQLTNEDVGEILTRSARVSPWDPNLRPWDDHYGWGVVDADAATAAVSGNSRIEQGANALIGDIGQSVNLPDVYVQKWGGLTSNRYIPRRHTIHGQVFFSQSYIATPWIWTRDRSSMGAGAIPAIINEDSLGWWIPETWLWAAIPSQATFETYVYEFLYFPGGGSTGVWWPTSPAGVQFAYTALGPAQVADVADQSRSSSLALNCGPNPCLRNANLEFWLDVASQVSVDVLDVQGRRVRTLARERMAAGNHRITWDLTNDNGLHLSPGVYWAILTAGDRSRSRKLVIAR